MSKKLYALVVGSLMYVMLCIEPNIYNAAEVVSMYQSNSGLEHWIPMKHIFKYLKRTRDYMLVYSSGSLDTIGFTYLDFQKDFDSSKSTMSFVFSMNE